MEHGRAQLPISDNYKINFLVWDPANSTLNPCTETLVVQLIQCDFYCIFSQSTDCELSSGDFFTLKCKLGMGVGKTFSSLVLCFLAEFTGNSRSSETVKTSLCYLFHLKCCNSESCCQRALIQISIINCMFCGLAQKGL